MDRNLEHSILHLSVDNQKYLRRHLSNWKIVGSNPLSSLCACLVHSMAMDAKLKTLPSRTITNWKFICINGYTVSWRNLRLLYQGHVNNWVYHHLSVRMGLHSFVHIYSICLENKIDLYVWNLVQRLQIFSQLWICQTQDIYVEKDD